MNFNLFIYKNFLLKNKQNIYKLLLLSFFIYPIQNVLIGKIVNTIFSQLKNKNHVKWILIILSSILCILSILLYIKNHIEVDIISEFNRFIEKDIFDNFLKSKKENFKEINVIEYIYFTENLNSQFKTFLQKIINNVIPFVFIILGIILYLLFITPLISLFLLITSGLLFLMFYIFSKNIFEKLEKKNKLGLQYKTNIQNKFHNLDNILIQNNIEKESNLNKNMSEFLKNMSDNIFEYTYNFFKIYLGLLCIFVSFILYFNFNNYFNSEPYTFTMVLILLITYFNQFFNIIHSFFDLNYKYSQFSISKKYFENEMIDFIYDEKKLIQKIKYGKIEFKNVSFYYNSDIPVFNHFNITIPNYQTTAIIGSSGKGKTTLIKLILKLYTIQKGEIFIDSIPISKYDTDQLRNQITYCNQKTHLIESTIYENIIYGSKINISKKNVEIFLKKYKFDNQFLNILDNYVGIDGNNMSLGMQKMISIFRCLLTKPKAKIYILDEPFTSLDPINVQKIFDMIHTFIKNKKKTFIIITHDKKILPLCQNIITL